VPFKINSVNEAKIESFKKHIMISVIVAAVAISISLVVMKFLFDLWGYNARVQSAQRESLTTLEENIEIYDNLVPWYQGLTQADGTPADPDPEIVNNALPEQYDFPALASSIEKLADSSGVNLLSLQGVDEEGSAPGPSHQPEPYEIRFSAEVGGSYEDIQVFMSTLDLSIRPFQVKEIELTGSDDDLTADILLVTFFQPEQNLNFPERTVQ